MNDTLIFYVREILGSAPSGFESVEYIVAGALLLVLCMSAISMISGIFKWIGGM